MTKEEIIKLIDFSKLKRNYLKNPIIKQAKPRDIPFKEDLEYLYLELNLTKSDVSLILGISDTILGKYFEIFSIRKPKELKVAAHQRTCLKHFGTISPIQSKQIQSKIKKTCLEKYGVDNPFRNVEKIKECRKNKYGVEFYSQTKEYSKKFKSTCQKKYGTEYPMQNKDFLKKCQESYFQKTGYRHNWNNPEIYKKSEETRLKKYGNTSMLKIPEISLLSRTPEVKEKMYNTKKQNHTFNGSSAELKIYNLLKEKFPDTLTQYKSSVYPYSCDFYIPSLDVYIEYQGSWTHGYHPYDKNNPQDLKTLEKWKEKSKEINFKGKPKLFYLNAINTWTDLDVRKREIACKNKLKYLEFFNEKEFLDWFNKQ